MIHYYNRLKKEFDDMGRDGVSERIIKHIDAFNKNPSYKNAVILAGKLKALTYVCRGDCYWNEKAEQGFYEEFNNLTFIKDHFKD